MNISPAITKGFSRTLLQAQKHSPILLTVVGVVGLVGAGILAARATLKLEETVDTGQNRIDQAKREIVDGAPQGHLTKAYLTNIYQIGKLYYIPVTLAAGSIIAILAGQHILNQRYAALGVAYQGLQTAFNNYRKEVTERYGEDVDQDIRYGLQQKAVTGENGKTKKTQELDRVGTSDYIFDFGPNNQNWVGNFEHNMFFLTGQQNIANDLLRARGHVMLSEVLDALGIERTPASLVTGWIYDPKKEKSDTPRDNYILFGIKDLWETHGYILLDFNVDGVVYDLI